MLDVVPIFDELEKAFDTMMRYNMIEAKSKELTLLKAREEANLCHYSGLRTVESYHILEDF